MTTPQATTTGKHLFKTRTASINYILPTGKNLIFVNHCYMTDSAYEIEHLNAEIELGHKELYVDPNEVTVSEDRSNPVAALRRRIAMEERAKLMEEMAAGKDFGSYAQGNISPASTTDIAPVTANGDATARLTALKGSVAKVVAEAPVAKT